MGQRTTKLTSREFNQETGRAKRAAQSGPVIITDRGRPSHVLLSFADYQRLASRRGSVIELLGLPPDAPDVELPLARPRDLPRIPDLGD